MKAVRRHPNNAMKILFFSSDHSEVELVTKEFVEAGIPCEMRVRKGPKGARASDAELWIRDDQDWYRASMLCVQLAIGLGRPAASAHGLAA